jgi:hypothetical protein
MAVASRGGLAEGSILGPSMGPDGRVAVSGRVESNSEILLFSSTGEFLKRLTFDLAFDGWLSWSPIVD